MLCFIFYILNTSKGLVATTTTTKHDECSPSFSHVLFQSQFYKNWYQPWAKFNRKLVVWVVLFFNGNTHHCKFLYNHLSKVAFREVFNTSKKLH